MNLRHEKTAVPIPSAATGGEQPFSLKTEPSIADTLPKSNPPEDGAAQKSHHFWDWEELDALHTVSMTELYENTYPSRPLIIDGLLHTGTYLFAGAPKTGKSFLMAQLAYHVSTGLSLWEYPVHKGTVLYLALEDDYRRLQDRLYRMFGAEATENLHFAVFAKKLNIGLSEQLGIFLREHRDTKLVIIDTLQKIRESSGDKCSYAADYEVIGQLRQFADKSGICLLLVHHTRKQQADDRFDMISGTNGLLGAADGAFLLHKNSRTSPIAKLEISGRDQQERLLWELDHAEVEAYREAPDPVLDAVAAILTEEQPEWSGTATELAALLPVEIKPNALGMKLNIRSDALAEQYHVRCECSRTRSVRSVSLRRIPDVA